MFKNIQENKQKKIYEKSRVNLISRIALLIITQYILVCYKNLYSCVCKYSDGRKVSTFNICCIQKMQINLIVSPI